MECRVYHVMSNGRNGWKGMLENAGRASVMGERKQEVVDRTIAMAKSHTRSAVVIHRADGSVQEERTYPRG